MNTADFRLMPRMINIVQRAARKLMAQEDPVMSPFQDSAITRTIGSEQQICYKHLKASKYLCFSDSYL